MDAISSPPPHSIFHMGFENEGADNNLILSRRKGFREALNITSGSNMRLDLDREMVHVVDDKEIAHPKSSAIHNNAGRLPHLLALSGQSDRVRVCPLLDQSGHFGTLPNQNDAT